MSEYRVVLWVTIMAEDQLSANEVACQLAVVPYELDETKSSYDFEIVAVEEKDA